VENPLVPANFFLTLLIPVPDFNYFFHKMSRFMEEIISVEDVDMVVANKRSPVSVVFSSKYFSGVKMIIF